MTSKPEKMPWTALQWISQTRISHADDAIYYVRAQEIERALTAIVAEYRKSLDAASRCIEDLLARDDAKEERLAALEERLTLFEDKLGQGWCEMHKSHHGEC
jgi:hypothetical protein